MSDTPRERERPRSLLERFERLLDAVIPPPDDVAAMVVRGESLLAAGDFEGALRQAQAALSAAPLYLRAVYLSADALAAKGDPRAALAVFDEAARERAMNAEALARMAELAAHAGDARRALELESQARARTRERDATVAQRLLAGARALIAQGELSAGARLLRGATLADPTLGPAWVLLAEDARKRGDVASARRSLERAAGAIDPGDAAVNRAAGELFLSLGDPPSAVRLLRRAWIVGDAGALAPLVVALFRAGDTAGLERVLVDAEGSVARVARALVALGQGDANARDALGELRGGDVPDALWPLALEAALRSAPEVAERWASEAADRPGAHAVTALAQARSLLASGDAARARATLLPALEDARTEDRAVELFRETCAQGWRGRLDVLLDELSAMVRSEPSFAPLELELRARRRELDEPLRVAILGEFSAGKSTFLNALVGATVSPMGVLPTTAHVHWLRHGERGARVVDARGGAVLATVDEAPRVVERMREAGERIDYVEVTLPVPRLARVELIDTPGFNAGDAEHEAAVRRGFRIADVALWLFDARQAGKKSETGPLEEARAAGLSVLGVLNKIDGVKPADRAKLLSVVREGFGELAPVPLMVSSREALRAALVLSEDPPKSDEPTRERARAEMASSGFAALLAYLDEHLVLQRAAWKQRRIAGRAAELVSSAEGLLTEHEARAARVEAQRAELLAALAALREALAPAGATLRSEVSAVLREQFRGLDRRRGGGAREGAAGDIGALASDAAGEVAYRARVRAMEKLAPRWREVERLAIETGALPSEAGGLVAALVTARLDHAAAEGVRDASAHAQGPSYVPADALAALEQTAMRDAGDAHAHTHRTLRAALEVAREELSRYVPPQLPVLE